MCKTARLLATTVDRQRLAAHGLLHEAWQDHAVVAALTRPDGIEQARDDDWQTALFGMCRTQPLAHRLGAGIATAQAFGRTGANLGSLHERYRPIAVDLAARRNQHRHAVLRASPQNGLRRMQVGLHDGQRFFGETTHTNDASQMEDQIGAGDSALRDITIGSRLNGDLEARMVSNGFEVVQLASRQVIDDVHRVVVGQEQLNQMGADEPSTTGDDGTPRLVAQRRTRMGLGCRWGRSGHTRRRKRRASAAARRQSML